MFFKLKIVLTLVFLGAFTGTLIAKDIDTNYLIIAALWLISAVEEKEQR